MTTEREKQLEQALKNSLRWMGKALADGAFDGCSGNAELHFKYLNKILKNELIERV